MKTLLLFLTMAAAALQAAPTPTPTPTPALVTRAQILTKAAALKAAHPTWKAVGMFASLEAWKKALPGCVGHYFEVVKETGKVRLVFAFSTGRADDPQIKEFLFDAVELETAK